MLMLKMIPIGVRSVPNRSTSGFLNTLKAYISYAQMHHQRRGQ
jgi:hypothetical protein